MNEISNGPLFHCACCKEETPCLEAEIDRDVGPVCQMCYRSLKWAGAWMKVNKFEECREEKNRIKSQ